MKKIIKLLLVLFPVLGISQTTTQNYIKTVTYKVATATVISAPTITQASQSVTYFDGLGRPIQQIANQQSQSGKDIITHIKYDGFGRQVEEYLPFKSSNTNMAFDPAAEVNVLGYYGSPTLALTGNPNQEATANPFSKKELEASPLSRVLKQAASGNDWRLGSGNEIKIDYQTNIVDEVKLFAATTTWNPVLGLYNISFLNNGTSYGLNQLYKTITYDENSGAAPLEKNGSTVEFKNKEGQVILKRTYDATTKHDTYYVYDIYGNLTYVIPPKADTAITQAVLDGLCYQYKYDGQNRLVEKKLPGKQWEFIVYDKLDRPVATGPAFSPFKDDTAVGWIITKYDAFSRPIYTGWSNQAVSSATRNTLQTTQNAATALFENKQTSGTIDGIATYYSNANAPTSFKLLTVNYYDNYVFPGAQTLPSTIEGQTVLANVKTMATGSWTRAVTTAAAIAGETSTLFYDEYARPIQTYSVNYLGGYTIISTNLDFPGKTIYTVKKHKRTSGSIEMIVREEFTYSPQDRLLTHTHQINGGAIQLMAANTYDDLGQLMSKNVGNTAASPLQKVDFSYNIRGWLTEINKAANLQQGTDAKDLFAFKVSYNKPLAAIAGVNALYNGNISETLWKTGSDNIERGYGYAYDKLNRLKNSIYEKNGLTTNAYDENLTYDKNGNILTLLRKGDIDPEAGTIIIDNLVYGPVTNSNQLAKVDDSSNNTSGFNDLNKTGDDYTYDTNGNMITDKNKSITAITYNQLNLPKKITFGTTGNIEYIYNAAGQKIQKVVSETGKTTIVTDYLGGFQYKDNILEFFPTAEGYVKNTANVLSYVFQYKDHLGNVRVSYAKNPTTQVLEIIEENNYYPFGLKHKGYNDYTPNTNKYKFLGQERQDELGLNWDTFRHRNYDYAIGRFFGVDPVSEEYMSISTYQFAHNNPVRKIEIEGLEGAPSNGKTDITNHEPIKVKNTPVLGLVGTVFKSEVVQQSAPKVVEKVAGGLSPLAKLTTNVVSIVTAVLHDYMSPNFGRTSEMKMEVTHKITGDAVKTDMKTVPYGSETAKADSNSEIIYRGGSFTDANFTPRPGKDDGVGPKSGLSTFTDPVKATMGEGGKAQALSVDLLKNMGFQLTNVGGHVGVRPPNQTLLEKWAQSRGTAPGTNPAQILTEMVKSARIEEIKVPKTN